MFTRLFVLREPAAPVYRCERCRQPLSRFGDNWNCITPRCNWRQDNGR